MKTGSFEIMRAYRVKVLVVVLGVLFASLGLLASSPADAFPVLFIVNNTADPGDGNCTAHGCTLREAINEANDFSGKDAIHFDIPGGGVKTISPASPLPEITDEVTIDGYTQPGTSSNSLAKGTDAVLKIELNGENAGDFVDGLSIAASNSVVRGLVINRFGADGTELSGSNNKVAGNFIGTGPGGTLDRGNGNCGVAVLFEGTSGNTIGGTTPAARNLISGNGCGITIDYGASDNEIRGNLIGTQNDGTTPLGNSGSGVAFDFGGDNSAFDNVVGGDTSAAANTIAFNGDDGVQVTDEGSTGNRVLRNSIFGNGGLGIDLVGGTENAADATFNDPGDPDSGPNDLQNKPNLTSAENSGGETTIEGELNSKPNQPFTVRFFSNPPDTNEGKRFIGKKKVSTSADGLRSFAFEPDKKVSVGRNITATATDPDGNTSEFSGSEEVV